MDAIKVVLASPSDLKQERQMIKDLIDDEVRGIHDLPQPSFKRNPGGISS